jgi:tRNA pseudouridine65 synthase
MSGLDFVRFLYEDEHIIVALKPAKLAVHPSGLCRDKRTLLSLVRNKGGGEHVYPVHRLDKPVSGPVIFTRTPEVSTLVQKQFESKSIQKKYLCLTRGWTPEKGTIDHPLKKPENGNMQESLTTYECLSHSEWNQPFGQHSTTRYSLLSMTPVTGRFHQLRRHLRDISYPIIGDTTHGDSHQNRFFREQFELQRLILHCYFLGFKHPISNQAINIFLPPDHALFSLFNKLGIQDLSHKLEQLSLSK